MRIPHQYDAFFEPVHAGERKTFSDAQTKLFVRFQNTIYAVVVDRGIVKDIRPNIRKCDFLCYNDLDKITHLIELKGAKINEALEQILKSVDNISEIQELSFLVQGLQKLDAYIVSPIRQEIPNGINDKRRMLARKLAARSNTKFQDITSLVKFVKVLPKQAAVSDDGTHVLISNQAPLELD